MPDVSTGTTMIKSGSTLRIGYRAQGSAVGFTYFPVFYSQNQLPLTYSLPSGGSWEVEYTQVCPNCSGGLYSDPIIVVVSVT